MFRLLYKNLVFLLIFVILLNWADFIFAGIQILDIETTIKISICGDNIKDDNETCDGTDLAEKTCQNFGFTGGTLKCMPDCSDFDASECYSVTTTTTLSFPGGGGGGGGGTPHSVETKVIFEGRAYPLSKVNILKDGQLAVSTISGPDSKFYTSIEGLSSGNYLFAVYSEDSQERRSILFTFPVFITQGVITKISGIFISPTIDVDKLEVKKGEVIKIFGQTVPNIDVAVIINSEEEIYGKTKSDGIGAYLYNLDTIEVEMGNHLAKSRATIEEEISPLSQAISFKVGTKTVLKGTIKIPEKGDLNNDKKVNLVDFSILAYWYRRSISAEFAVIERERLNGDSKVDLIDFSILAYHWTG